MGLDSSKTVKGHVEFKENSPLLLDQTTLANFTLNHCCFSVGNKVTSQRLPLVIVIMNHIFFTSQAGEIRGISKLNIELQKMVSSWNIGQGH